MMVPAMLLLATLGSSPQDPPAAAPAPAGRHAPRTKVKATSASTEAAPATGGSASDEIQAGLDAFARRRFTQAQAAFERAVAADPQSAAAQFYLGYTIYKIAEPKRHDSPGKKEALEHFAKAYELDPNFKPAWGRSRG
jgi:tetratricopeptide (TPR) repeat protein